MSKGSLPVPHIITIVIGVGVIALMGYIFFQQGGLFSGETSRQQCLKAAAEYCIFYNPNRNWDTKYGSKPTPQNCIDYQSGKYNPCLDFKETKEIKKPEETKSPETTKTTRPNSMTFNIKTVAFSVLVDTEKSSPIVGFATAVESDIVEASLTEPLEFEITFDKLPEKYEFLVQYREKGEEEWKDYGDKRSIETLSHMISGNTLEFKTTPYLLTKEAGTYEFRVIGSIESVTPENFELKSNIKEIVIKPEVKNCGSQCGATTCKPYEACVNYGEIGEEVNVCKLSADCGATCDDVVSKYPTTFKIKEKPCNSYDNCFDFGKDDFGKSYRCNEYLCSGECVQKPDSEDGPKILETSINPLEGKPGTVFTIQAKVQSPYGLSEVRADITYREETARFRSTVTTVVTLYDDGEHGDVSRDDGIYGDVLDSSLLFPSKQLYRKYEDIEIIAKDVNDKMASTKIPFPIKLESGEELCREAIKGHNDKNGNKVNIVFVGINFDNLKDFQKYIERGLDFDGKKGGIFSQEPFKSNKDKFNFWYVSTIGQHKIKKLIDVRKIDKSEIGSFKYEARTLATACVFNNKYIIALSIGIRGFASLDLAVASPLDGGYEAMLTHEFGHSFGALDDEYEEGRNVELYEPGWNAYLGNSEKCLKESRWKNFVGDGCGEEGAIDCISNYNPSSKEIKCTTKDKKCHIEVGCFEGVSGFSKGGFRPTYNSIMRNMVAAVKDNTPRAFGLVNERVICNQIERRTGSAGGICDSSKKFGE